MKTKTAKQPQPQPFDVTGAIIEYEQGGMSDEDMVKLFQHLVDTGMAWQLQGHYGRMATRLIQAGLVHR